MNFADAFAGLNSASSLVKNAIEIVKGLGGGDREAVESLQKELVEAQQAVSSTFSALTALHDQNSQLRDENQQLVKERDKLLEKLELQARMTLARIGEGAFAYVELAHEGAVKNGPWYCQPCVEAGQCSVLQFTERKLHVDRYTCPACGSAIHVPNQVQADVRTTGRRRASNLDDF